MIDYFEEINAADSFSLTDFKEPRVNRLSINIREKVILPVEEYIQVGEKKIGPVHPIVSNDSCKKYNLYFESYTAYCVVNESFTSTHSYEEKIGRLFCIYSRSNYLDYIRKDTFAEEIREQELKHYAIICSDHVVHIASMDEPLVTEVV